MTNGASFPFVDDDGPVGDRVRINEVTRCWRWLGGHDEDGYAQIRIGMRKEQVHRLSYRLFRGPLPRMMVLDHLCCTKDCFNPAHLEPVTTAENTRRAYAARTHCANGHEYDDTTTYITPGGYRECKVCRNEASRRHKQRRRGQAAAA